MEVKEMNTEEAIEFLDKKGILDKVLKMKIKNVKKLAKMLQQGEADSKELKITKEELKKVWQMWEDFKGEYNHCYIKDVENVVVSWKEVKDVINNYEQKDFPKNEETDEKG